MSAVRIVSGMCASFIGGAVVTTAVTGTGLFLCFCGIKTYQWAKGGNDGINVNAAPDQWPHHVCHRIGTTFKYLAGSLGLTVGVALLASESAQMTYLRNCNSVWVYIGIGSAIVGSWLICKYTPYKPYFLSCKHVAWAFLCGATGSLLALLTSGGVSTLVMAGFSTALIITGHALYATVDSYVQDKTFLPWIRNLRIGLCIVSISSLALCFTSRDSLLDEIFGSVVCNGSLALFPAYVLYHTEKMIDTVETTVIDDPFDPINAQMNLFSDGFWIFVLCVVLIDAIKE